MNRFPTLAAPVWARVAIAAGILLAAGCRGPVSNLSAEERWVGTWGCAPQLVEARNLPPSPGLAGNTLRQVCHVSIGGKRLRARFSNEFGDGPLAMSSAHFALSAGGGAIASGTDTALSFHGAPGTTILPGGAVWSDPFDFVLDALTNVSVTIRFGSTPRAVTGHPGARTTSYLQTGDAVAAADLKEAVTMQHWYVVNAIDVAVRDACAAVVVGDSLTDGRGSTTDGNNRWPDDLARRLAVNAATQGVAILNEGIGGNAVVSGGLGPTALARFDRDALGQSGVKWVILFGGVNDIGGSHSAAVATNLIAAYATLIDKARTKGLRVYGGTLTPFGGSMYSSASHEAERQSVNAWIRGSGRFDAVIDFDAATRDGVEPTHLRGEYNSGDHLHLNAAGYEAMARAVDLRLFESSRR